MSPKNHILIIHGPNLNMLGQRETDIYGDTSLDDINSGLIHRGDELGFIVETFQSNHEGALVEKIQQAMNTASGIIINPAAYTHTSVALRDALLLLNIPIVEIHLSNIDKRETFRRTSMIADVATGRIAGFGAHGYILALEAMVELIKAGDS